MRSGAWAPGFVTEILILLLNSAQGYTADSSPRKIGWTADAIRQAIEKAANGAQLVTFTDAALSPVRIVRGSAPATVKDTHGVTEAKPATTEIVTFADPRDRPVSILRGFVARSREIELFGPAPIVDLDRVAFAVDGAESSHGADLKMWRREPSGPQGPMQVTAAAAIDVGGGNRFDIAENRNLGRAYLARMYRRYGNWLDAIAAYNWGPGNLDLWISGGRAADQVPLEVEHYRERVLRDAALPTPAIATSGALTRPAPPEPSPLAGAGRSEARERTPQLIRP
jgi:hypothetical protein